MTQAQLAAALGGEQLRAGAGGPVRAVALALDPGDDVVAAAVGCDVLVLHRFYGLKATPPGLGVLGTHDWFDAQLPGWLAAALGIAAPVTLAGDARALVGESACDGIVVVAGAMTPELILTADAAGAALYVTGQWRAPASLAVAATGIDVLALGHARWERWGLEELGRRLRARWPGLDVRALG